MLKTDHLQGADWYQRARTRFMKIPELQVWPKRIHHVQRVVTCWKLNRFFWNRSCLKSSGIYLRYATFHNILSLFSKNLWGKTWIILFSKLKRNISISGMRIEEWMAQYPSAWSRGAISGTCDPGGPLQSPQTTSNTPKSIVFLCRQIHG